MPDSPLDPSSEHLPDNLKECHELITALRQEIRRLLSLEDIVKQLQEQVAELQKQVRRRNRMIFGKSSARVKASNLTGTGKEVYDHHAAQLQDEPSNGEKLKETKHGGGGRTATTAGAQAPREVHHEINDESKLACAECGELRRKIGFEASHQLEFLDSALELLKHIQFKYACSKCDAHVVTAEKPSQPIAKGLAGPGLIAHTGRAKYDWHQPLYRQERIYKAQGRNLARSTLCRILKEGADLLDIIAQRMLLHIKNSRIVLSDATGMPVIKKGLGHVHNGCIWIFGDEKYSFYEFSETKGGEHPSRTLKGYTGVLLTDGAQVYNGITKKKAGCSAHAFRYFEDARKEDPVNADYALAMFKSLFDIERHAANFSEQDRKEIRARLSKPILNQLKYWLDEQIVIPKTAMGEAVTYCKNQWDALAYFADTGFVPIHNNQSENGLRPTVLGKKNWLFAGSIEGGHTAATWMTIVQTCRRHEIDPFVYLKDVFTRMPAARTSEIDQFLPDKWKELQNKK